MSGSAEVGSHEWIGDVSSKDDLVTSPPPWLPVTRRKDRSCRRCRRRRSRGKKGSHRKDERPRGVSSDVVVVDDEPMERRYDDDDTGDNDETRIPMAMDNFIMRMYGK